MVLSQQRVKCPLWVGSEVLPQVEEFKYLRGLLMSEGSITDKIDRQIGAASALMCRSVVVKRELSQKARLWSRTVGGDRENEIADTSD